MNPMQWQGQPGDTPLVRRLLNLVEMSQQLCCAYQRSASYEQVHASLVMFARRGGQELDGPLAQWCSDLDDVYGVDVAVRTDEQRDELDATVETAIRRAFDVVMCEIRRIAEGIE